MTHKIAVEPATPQELELETVGGFRVLKAKDETSRCGPVNSPRVLHYKVTIVADPRLLDGPFIIDWQKVAVYFRTTFHKMDVFPSCERIAFQACVDILAMVGEERCIQIEVVIGASKAPSGMKARWRRT